MVKIYRIEKSSEWGLETLEEAEEECKRKKSEMPTCRLVPSPFSYAKGKRANYAHCTQKKEWEKKKKKNRRAVCVNDELYSHYVAYVLWRY